MNLLSFEYEHGTKGESGSRSHAVDVATISGSIHVHCTFQMCSVNPIPYRDGLPDFVRSAMQRNTEAKTGSPTNFDEAHEQTQQKVSQPLYGDEEPFRPARLLQTLSLGRKNGDDFEVVVRFGLVDDGRAEKGTAYITPWVNTGGLDYYSLYCRPNTPYDFNIKADLKTKRLTAWVSGRGDCDWYYLVEDAVIQADVDVINHVQVEQYPGAAGITDLTVGESPTATADAVLPHPLAKKDRTVAPGRGFRFQSMRSVWGKIGRHVTIQRNTDRWYGFPAVVQAMDHSLICAYSDGIGHGGSDTLFVQISRDLGLTWGEPAAIVDGGGSARLQRLEDGSLLLLTHCIQNRGGEKFLDVVLFDSHDCGRTWVNQRWMRAISPSRTPGDLMQPSEVVVMPDGSWRLATHWFELRPGTVIATQPLHIKIWKSTDQGTTWEALADIGAWPPHHLDEASLMLLPDGQLQFVAREWRDDYLPAIKGTSDDGGRSWELEELPFHIHGRTCGRLLADGRAFVSFRTGCGRTAQWAWVEDPLATTPPFRAGGAHFNDRHSVGIKDGELHIDSDGVCGQFTRYYLRPADTPETSIDLSIEVKIVSNSGRGATVSIPYAGEFRLLGDRIQMVGHEQMSAAVESNSFHVYRFVRVPGRLTVFIDGQRAFESDEIDERVKREGSTQQESLYVCAFGNESTLNGINVYPDQMSEQVTGYSIWRRYHQILDDPKTGRKEISWSADSGEFPDQYQLDHMVEVAAAATSHDLGYPGWTQIHDGRIFAVDYTDDTAPPNRPGSGIFGRSCIRGTFVELTDLPPTQNKGAVAG
ncbi:MAG: exo-alpha-sialidase [Gemmatimonadetes bacterium]|nr:exo-alpha-sialidase [Gemmatimonadota bacterium]